MSWDIKAIAANSKIKAAIKFRTPAITTGTAQVLLIAVAQQVQGILHLGGKERICRYDFGLLLRDILQLPTDSINCK